MRSLGIVNDCVGSFAIVYKDIWNFWDLLQSIIIFEIIWDLLDCLEIVWDRLVSFEIFWDHLGYFGSVASRIVKVDRLRSLGISCNRS